MTNLAYIIHIEPFKCPPSGCKTSKMEHMCLKSGKKQSPLLAAFKTANPLSFSPAALCGCLLWLLFLISTHCMQTEHKLASISYSSIQAIYLYLCYISLKIRERLSPYQPGLTKRRNILHIPPNQIVVSRCRL